MDLFTRATVYALLGMTCLVLVLTAISSPVHGNAAVPLVVLVVALVITATLVCVRFARRAMDAYLGRGPVSRTLLGWSAASVVTTAAVILLLASPSAGGDPAAVIAMLTLLSTQFLTVHALIVPPRVSVVVQLVAMATLSGLSLLLGVEAVRVAVFSVIILLASGWSALAVRFSLWVLAMLWELHEARDTRARLAVAEERLRFARDLHDVLGRNLAVIALKSELATELARRGRPEAVEQMTEVQRIARDAQREVRDVVRGYREADLRVELEGARGVLNAAGIECTVVQGPGEVPEPVRPVLGWVVREATTNVLRHGDARRCTISVGCPDGTVVLTVENDGAEGATVGTGGSGSAADADAGTAPGMGAAGGTGLAGLRERLAPLGGALEAGPVRTGHFRLTVRVPRRAEAPAGAGDGKGSA
ncbi:sensor histidine kinase [Streptomyces sp. NPDC057638]|uniref:sensor histidine kinase n=1 Tax=Streptomyces sp. NPDC057638 TaxID=3346190 RepID=UPI0036C5A9FB